MSVYLSGVVREQLRAAQAQLDEHPMGMDARCRRCGTPGSCAAREAALAVFARYRRLPRRRPGASRPDLVRGLRARLARSA